MPLYDYKCKRCGYIERDVKRNILENVSTYECKKCKGEMNQIYNSFGFDLKGNGWYETDYKNKTNVKENN